MPLANFGISLQVILKTKDMKKELIYGPVPSRRLGRSLGVDLVLDRVCSYDCIYCQLGRTEKKTIERKSYVPARDILDQLYQKLEGEIEADYITLGGSGEPTLNSEIGSVITDLKKHTNVPVAVLTNSSLLANSNVRQSIIQADVVLPSLDAYNQKGFERINRPHPEINFEAMAEGLITFRQEYRGKIWLEIFVLDSLNAGANDALEFKKWITKINPDKVHINTAVRPTAESFASRVPDKALNDFCVTLGQKAEVVTPFSGTSRHNEHTGTERDLLNLLARRPCTLDDISFALNVGKERLLRYIEPLVENHTIDMSVDGTTVYYKPKRTN